ncbi:kinase-like domain protein [Podospora fimiseda]|uniref:Kinase-like domain protein n=1 Tax=Podospora fimiseda TaxID=252190 RepID=A0AAN7BGM8_9PEZI|nr:kinase-like domain protein [Podospora fimiseda]
MDPPQKRNANVRLLACLLSDEQDTEDSDYRFLVDGQHIKYMTTAPGAFRGNEEDRNFEPILLPDLLPQFPPGDWNHAHVAWDPETQGAVFVKTETVEHPGLTELWHPTTFNELDFTRLDRPRQRVHISTHPKFNGGKPVCVKFAVWPWEIGYIEAETESYQWIYDSGIGPKFLGHLAEGRDGRIIGFVTEWVQDARSTGPEDLEACKKALSRLHKLGIKHGDINRFNFFVRDGHEIVLVDFESAKRDCSPEELQEEMDALKSKLESMDFRGGVHRCTE